MIEMLRALKADLEMDLMFCTTRDSHIRLAQRIAYLESIISQSSSERDTAHVCDTVLP